MRDGFFICRKFTIFKLHALYGGVHTAQVYCRILVLLNHALFASNEMFVHPVVVCDAALHLAMLVDN